MRYPYNRSAVEPDPNPDHDPSPYRGSAAEPQEFVVLQHQAKAKRVKGGQEQATGQLGTDHLHMTPKLLISQPDSNNMLWSQRAWLGHHSGMPRQWHS